MKFDIRIQYENYSRKPENFILRLEQIHMIIASIVTNVVLPKQENGKTASGISRDHDSQVTHDTKNRFKDTGKSLLNHC